MPKPYRAFFNMLPDPFFIRARRSNAGMRELARQCVDKRLASATMRDDILNKLIESKLKETQNGVLLEEDISELTSESITLLCVFPLFFFYIIFVLFELLTILFIRWFVFVGSRAHTTQQARRRRSCTTL